jgi:hypothetical protein
MLSAQHLPEQRCIKYLSALATTAVFGARGFDLTLLLGAWMISIAPSINILAIASQSIYS